MKKYYVNQIQEIVAMGYNFRKTWKERYGIKYFIVVLKNGETIKVERDDSLVYLYENRTVRGINFKGAIVHRMNKATTN